jgi:hypothetical protein
MSKIVNVIRGPIHSSQIPDWDEVEDGFGLPYGEGYVLFVVLQDDRGVLSDEELIFESFDEAIDIVDHFVNQTVPLFWEDTF